MERSVSVMTSMTSSGALPVQLTHSAMGVARSRAKSMTHVVRSRASGIASSSHASHDRSNAFDTSSLP